MRQKSKVGWMVCLGIAGLCLATVASAADKLAPEAKTSAAGNESATEKKVGNRLPPYYSKVVTQEQREKVLGVYNEYNTKITKLKDDIKALTAARDAALQGLLTAEQREKLIKVKAEAKTKDAAAAK